jgi:hypothetical protein
MPTTPRRASFSAASVCGAAVRTRSACERSSVKSDWQSTSIGPISGWMSVPQLDELRRALDQGRDERAGSRVRAHRPERRAQCRDLRPAVAVAIGLRVACALPVGPGEPAVDLAAVEPGVLRHVTEEGCGQAVLHERLAQIRDDERRGVLEPVEDPQEGRGHMRPGVGAIGRAVVGEAEEVVALVVGEAQRPRDRREHRRAGLRAPLLLEARVVVDGHRREERDLLPPQPRRAAASSGGQAGVARLQCLPVTAEEVGECCAVHGSILRATPLANQGSPIPR